MTFQNSQKIEQDALREAVAARCREIIAERATDPDHVIFVGEGLEDLDPNLVTLRLDSEEHPRMWARKTKWVVTVLIGIYCFLAPFASTIFAPSISSVMKGIDESDPTRGALVIAIFLLAFAVGPIILAPLSEMYGRVVVLRAGNIVFAAFSIGAGFCTTTSQMAVCRFFAGMGGSSSFAIMGGILADIWNLHDRTKASAVLGIAIIMGPVLGPSCGGWMSERASWRWTCWAPAIAAAAVEVVASFFLRESYLPTLLQRRLKQVQKQRPNASLYTTLDLSPVTKSKSAALAESMSRPIAYLLLDPALLLLSLYYAYVFGVLYLIIVTFQRVFGEGYGHSPGFVGLDLLAEGLGALIGMIGTARILNLIFNRQTGKVYRSETRLLGAFIGAVFTGAGLFIYAFTAYKTHFLVPLVGVCLFAMGAINTYLYIIESFDYPASAIAGLSVLRCLFAGVFPLFGDDLFFKSSIGFRWGQAMLAFLSIGLGFIFLPVVYFYGSRLREMGQNNRKRVFG